MITIRKISFIFILFSFSIQSMSVCEPGKIARIIEDNDLIKMKHILAHLLARSQAQSLSELCIFQTRHLSMVKMFEEYIETPLEMLSNKDGENLLTHAIKQQYPYNLIRYYRSKGLHEPADRSKITRIIKANDLATMQQILESLPKHRAQSLSKLYIFLTETVEMAQLFESYLGIIPLEMLENKNGHTLLDNAITQGYPDKLIKHYKLKGIPTHVLGRALKKMLTERELFDEIIASNNLIEMDNFLATLSRNVTQQLISSYIFRTKHLLMVQLLAKHLETPLELLVNTRGENLLVNAIRQNYSNDLIEYYRSIGLVEPFEHDKIAIIIENNNHIAMRDILANLPQYRAQSLSKLYIFQAATVSMAQLFEGYLGIIPLEILQNNDGDNLLVHAIKRRYSDDLIEHYKAKGLSVPSSSLLSASKMFFSWQELDDMDEIVERNDHVAMRNYLTPFSEEIDCYMHISPGRLFPPVSESAVRQLSGLYIFRAKTLEMAQLFESYLLADAIKTLNNEDGDNLLVNAVKNKHSIELIEYYKSKGLIISRALPWDTEWLFEATNSKDIEYYRQFHTDLLAPIVKEDLGIRRMHIPKEVILRHWNVRNDAASHLLDKIREHCLGWDGLNLLQHAIINSYPVELIAYYLELGLMSYDLHPLSSSHLSPLALLFSSKKNAKEKKEYIKVFLDAKVPLSHFIECIDCGFGVKADLMLIRDVLPEKTDCLIDIIIKEHLPAIDEVPSTEKKVAPESPHTDDENDRRYFEYFRDHLFDSMANPSNSKKFTMSCTLLKRSFCFPYQTPIDRETRHNLHLMIGDHDCLGKCLANKLNATHMTAGRINLCAQLIAPLVSPEELEKRQNTLEKLRKAPQKGALLLILKELAENEGPFISFTNERDQLYNRLKQARSESMLPDFWIPQLKKLKKRWNESETGLFVDELKQYIIVPLLPYVIKIVALSMTLYGYVAAGGITATSLLYDLFTYIKEETGLSVAKSNEGNWICELESKSKFLKFIYNTGMDIRNVFKDVDSSKKLIRLHIIEQIKTRVFELVIYQQLLIYAAKFVRNLKQVETSLAKFEDKTLLSIADTLHATFKDEDACELADMFNTETFKETAYLSHWGRVKKAYMLMHEKIDKFSNAYAAIGMLDFLMGSVNLLDRSPQQYSLPQYIKPGINGPLLFATNYWNPMLPFDENVANSVNFGRLGEEQFPRSIIVTGLSGKGKSFSTVEALIRLALIAQALGIAPVQELKFTPFVNFLAHMVYGSNLALNLSYGQSIRARAKAILSIINQAKLHDFTIASLDEPWTGGDHPDICTDAAEVMICDIGLNKQTISISTTHHKDITSLEERHPEDFANYTVDRFNVIKGIGDCDNPDKLKPYEDIAAGFAARMAAVRARKEANRK